MTTTADAIETLNAFLIDAGPDARSIAWRAVATQQQVEDAYAVVLGSEPRWHFWLRPRGGSKTQDAALVALSCLLTIQPAFSRSLVYAVDKDQAALLLEKIEHLTAPLVEAGLLKVVENRVTNPATSASLTIESSDAPSALGQTPWLTIVDEFAAWPDKRNTRRLWSAILGSLAKRSDARLLVITSAGDPGNWTYKYIKQAQGSPEDWRSSYMPGPVAWHNPADTERLRRHMPDAEFAWHVLNEFRSGEDALVSKDDLTAAVTRGVTSRPYDPGQRYCLGIDLGRRVDASVVVVAHREEDRVVVDRVERWLPTKLRPVRLATVQAAITRLHEEYGGAHIRMDPAKGEKISQDLYEAGLTVEEYVFNETSIDKLAGTLDRLFQERRIDLPDVPDLLDELGTALIRVTASGKARIDHHHGKHDDQAVALALAAHWLMTQSFFGARTVSNAAALAGLSVRRATGMRAAPNAARERVRIGQRDLSTPALGQPRKVPGRLSAYDRFRQRIARTEGDEAPVAAPRPYNPSPEPDIRVRHTAASTTPTDAAPPAGQRGT